MNYSELINGGKRSRSRRQRVGKQSRKQNKKQNKKGGKKRQTRKR
tara:strand:+ start:2174 stop:2308 length:135 start_codon:yes stop_codon:yes gene_type:complete